MVNVLIVDDDAMIARLLTLWLSKYAQAGSVDIAENIEVAQGYIATRHYDLVLLDLNLNGQDGFELLQGSNDRPFEVIVVSSNYEKALEAFDLAVLDFVPKPVKESRFKQAIQRFLKILVNIEPPQKFITTSYGGVTKNIEIEQICYVKADGHYCQIHTVSGDAVLYSDSIENLNKHLSGKFERIHRSYLVNHKKISDVKPLGAGKYTVILEGGEVPMSRRYYREKYKK